MTTKTRPCSLCKQRPRSTHVIGPDLCDPCHEYAGWENTHNDEAHDEFNLTEYAITTGATIDDLRANCPICNDVPPPWTKENTVKTNTRPARTANPTTSHFSHAGCAHPRTPKDRAACRKSMRSGASPAAAPVIGVKHIQAKMSKVIHLATDAHTPLCASKLNVDTAQVYTLTAPSATCKYCLRLAATVDA